MKLTFDEMVKKLVQNNIGHMSNIQGENHYLCDFLTVGIGQDNEKKDVYYLYFRNPLKEMVLKNIFHDSENIKIVKIGKIKML